MSDAKDNRAALDPARLGDANDERKEKAAAEAADRIRRGQHWLDWMFIAEGLEVGRHKAMRRAGTDDIRNPKYKKAFNEWMRDRPWARDLDPPTRNHLFWCLDYRNEIEQWRETLAANERARLNHPTAMKRRYEATRREGPGKDVAPGVRETRAQKMEREVERLSGEVETWRRRAEADGSLFDLKRDSVANIARVIAERMSPGRLKALQQALAGEIGRLKAEKAQAG
jgi:hypothetical protein